MRQEEKEYWDWRGQMEHLLHDMEVGPYQVDLRIVKFLTLLLKRFLTSEKW